MKICSVCQRCTEDSADVCAEGHGSLVRARSGGRQITADYQLDFLLERDAASETYQATRRGFEDRSFVFKIFSATARDERIRSEAVAAAQLNHLNIARVCESGALDGDEFYVVTEAADGQTLRECLRRVGSFPEAEAVTIARHAAEALDAAHRSGIVHRAVSPSNILLAQDAEKIAVKLQNFDFGGVEQQNAVDALSGAKPPIERLRYLSPEQCAGEGADARSDVYSLAVVLYEMLCGRSPFGAPTLEAIAARQINEQPLERLGFDTRALLKHVLHSALQKRPEARPQTAGGFARQLRHVEQLLGLTLAAPREAVKSPAAAPSSNAAPLVFDDSPTFESAPSSAAPRPLPTQKLAPEISAPIPPVAAPPIETIEENAGHDAAFSAPIRVSKKESAAESTVPEAILIRQKELRDALPESAPESTFESAPESVPFEAASISVKKKFESEPISVRKKPLADDAAPVFSEREKTVVADAAPATIHTGEAIELPAADVREVGRRQSTAAIFADSHGEVPPRPASSRRPLLAGVGLLAVLISALLGMLLYNRRQQPSAAAPTVAQTAPVASASATPEAIAATSAAPNESGTMTESDTAEIEKPAATIGRAASARRENQTRETAAPSSAADETPTLSPSAPNESAKNRGARENPAASAAVSGSGGSRPRTVAADGDAQTELNASLADWVTATNDRNVERQMNHYAPQMNAYYRTRNVSPAAVRAEKQRVLASADQVDIQTGKPEIAVSPDGKTATMRFRKKYAIRQGQQNRRGEVVQELQWVKSGGGWRIVSERDVKVINR